MHLSSGLFVAAIFFVLVDATRDNEKCYRPEARSAPFETVQYKATLLENGTLEFRCPKGYSTYGKFGADGSSIFEMRSNVHSCDPATGKFYTPVQESALTTMSCVKNEKIKGSYELGLCTFQVRLVPYIMLKNTAFFCGAGKAVEIKSGQLAGQFAKLITCNGGTVTYDLSNGTSVKEIPSAFEIECAAESHIDDKCHRPDAPSAPFAIERYIKTKLENGTVEFRCPKGYNTFGNFGLGGSLVFETRSNVHSCDPATGRFYTPVQESALTTMSCVNNDNIKNSYDRGICMFQVRLVPYIVLNKAEFLCGNGEVVEIKSGSVEGHIVQSLTCDGGSFLTNLANGTSVKVPSAVEIGCVAMRRD